VSRLELIDTAFRTRAATLSVATTGSTTLAATAAGYTRSSGSFLVDGFRPGQEVTPAGFSSNTTPALITAVTATLLTIDGGRTAQANASGRTLTVGLPAFRVYENGPDFEPVTGRHYVTFELLEQPAQLLSFPASLGTREELGLYVFTWYGISGTGAGGLRRCVDALAALFTVGTSLALADGSSVAVRGLDGPFVGQLQQRPAGFALLSLSIPWRRYAINAITA
jgi:hypothetical protein